jgi:sugar lactone lactonase YvrE
VISELAAGFSFPEAPRWHEGQLWFVDRDGPVVYTMPLRGRPEPVATVAPKVMGLGFPAGGLPLVVSQAERRIYRLGPDGDLLLFADLAELTPFWLNDMLVLPDGSGYVGSFGFDLMNHADPQPSRLIRFEADGRARFTGPPLLFPNGIAQLSSGSLVVAESFGSRLTVIDVEASGDLSNGRTLIDVASLATHHPDGIAVDAQDSVWYADTFAGSVVKVSAHGVILEVIDLPVAGATACAFVGDDLRQLAVTTTEHLYPPEAMAHRSGRVFLLDVAVPGRRIAASSDAAAGIR